MKRNMLMSIIWYLNGRSFHQMRIPICEEFNSCLIENCIILKVEILQIKHISKYIKMIQKFNFLTLIDDQKLHQ